jgi:transcriptional regulator with XRE-family HTH domain
MKYNILLTEFRKKFNEKNNKKITTSEIARELGLSRSYVSNIFNGNESQPPTFDVHKSICDILKLNKRERKILEKAAVRERIDGDDRKYLESLGIWDQVKD